MVMNVVRPAKASVLQLVFSLANSKYTSSFWRMGSGGQLVCGCDCYETIEAMGRPENFRMRFGAGAGGGLPDARRSGTKVRPGLIFLLVKVLALFSSLDALRTRTMKIVA